MLEAWRFPSFGFGIVHVPHVGHATGTMRSAPLMTGFQGEICTAKAVQATVSESTRASQELRK